MKNLLLIDSFAGLVGTTPEMRKVFEDAIKVAPTHAPVLIIGESGTGRRSLARAIHKVRGGEENQFTILAYYGETGKTEPVDIKARMKLFEKKKGRTLFVEEIANLSLAEQFELVELLRSSSAENKQLNVRLIASTRMDLKRMIENGKFRGDLYFLFFVMKLPPLRERSDDIIPLVELFLKRYSKIYRKRQLGLSPQTEVEIMRHSWPGNVAELESRIKRAVIVGEERIMPTDLGLKYDEKSNETLSYKKAREELNKEFLKIAIAQKKGNITQTAKEMGVTRPTVYLMLKKYGK